jgi:ankyrin repeat protein
VPEDPRGTKRGRENDPEDSDEPVLKHARTEPAAESVDEPINKPIDKEQVALYAAIESGDTERVTALLEQSPRLRDSYFPGEDGLTPLCLAAQLGHLNIVRFLVSSGNAVDAPAKNGSTPLMFASQRGHVEMILQLCRLAADPLAINPRNGWNALTGAVDSKQLDACKALIANGANVLQPLNIATGIANKFVSVTPLHHAIAADFAELIVWWLDENQLTAGVSEPGRSASLLSIAVAYGALTVVQALMQRGTNLNDVVMIGPDSQRFEGVWSVAAHFQHFKIIEYLLSTGYRPQAKLESNSALCAYIGIGLATDLCIHLGTQTDANIPADRLTNSQFRQHPELALDGLAERYFASSITQWFSAVGWWCDQGLLSAMFSFMIRTRPSMRPFSGNEFISSARLLGKNAFPPERYPSIIGATKAQQAQILAQFLFDIFSSPEWPLSFSGLKLTAQGEQTMNQIAVAQGDLMLKGIDRFRDRFGKQVVTLPDICMDSYISLSHQLNEPDLYRRITSEWGLYDPIARAAIRLVKEARANLRALVPEYIPPEFAAMSPSEQLRHAMVESLKEWDKIPELEESPLNCYTQELDFTSDLLYEQWCLFCEAFDVGRLLYPQFSPHRPEVQPVTEVDEGRSPTLTAAPLTPVPLTPQ